MNSLQFLAVTALVLLRRAVECQVAHVLIAPDGTCPEGTVLVCQLDEIHVRRCTRRDFICDGIPHCPQGEDEDPDGCNRKGEGIFSQQYMFHNISVPSSKACVLSVYPDVCRCSYSTRIECNHRALTQLPTNISAGITHLYLHHNHIQLKGNELAAMKNLTMLNLNSNQLDYIPEGFLANQKHLIKLLLRNNSLSQLDASLFASARHIRHLLLDSNRLSRVPPVIFSQLVQLTFLNLSENLLTLDEFTFPTSRLKYLELARNRIRKIGRTTFAHLHQVNKLSLRSNRIHFIDSLAFANNVLLDELDISRNRLAYFDAKWTHKLTHLRLFKVGFNPMRTLPVDAFKYNANLTNIDLEKLIIDDIDRNIWIHLHSLETIKFSQMTYCSYVPRVKFCSPSSDGVSSSYNLLATPLHRAAIWLIAVLTLSANTVVLCSRWLAAAASDENSHVRILISNLAAADMLMGVYLLIIACKDIEYRDQYNRHALEWMNSYLCTASGVVALTSSETTVLILTYMSVERYLVIVHPLTQPGLAGAAQCGHSTMVWLAVIWSTGFAMALLPVFLWSSHSSFYGLNAVCLPLHVQQPFTRGWQYSATVFIALNLSSVVVVSAAYTAMFVNIKHTRRNTTLVIREMSVAVRFFFVVLTDALCWMPIVLVKVAALAGVLIPDNVHAWIVVFVLPINSAVNPLLYTLSTSHLYARVRSTALRLVHSRTQRESINLTGSEAVATGQRTSVNVVAMAGVAGVAGVAASDRDRRHNSQPLVNGTAAAAAAAAAAAEAAATTGEPLLVADSSSSSRCGAGRPEGISQL